MSGQLWLHWGFASRGGGWKAPPENFLPLGTKKVDDKAVQSPFKDNKLVSSSHCLSRSITSQHQLNSCSTADISDSREPSSRGPGLCSEGESVMSNAVNLSETLEKTKRPEFTSRPPRPGRHDRARGAAGRPGGVVQRPGRRLLGRLQADGPQHGARPALRRACACRPRADALPAAGR